MKMILNLTLNPSEHFKNDDVTEYRREEVWDMLALFWSDSVSDFIHLSSKIADLAEESGIKKAVIDVPSYAVSILETELMLRGIIPFHYYSGQFIDTKTEVLLENLYNILEKETSIQENLPEEEEAVKYNPACPTEEQQKIIEKYQKMEDPDEVLEPSFNDLSYITDEYIDGIFAAVEDVNDIDETIVVESDNNKDFPVVVEEAKIRRARPFNLTLNPKLNTKN